MTGDEFEAMVLEMLDRLEDRDLEASLPGQNEHDWFLEIAARFSHAKAAFPGMTWDEFQVTGTKRARKGKKGSPGRSVSQRAKEKKWLAARDADRIKVLWQSLNPQNPGCTAPKHPHDIAAQRHGIDRQTVDDAVNRPNNRRLDRLTAHK